MSKMLDEENINITREADRIAEYYEPVKEGIEAIIEDEKDEIIRKWKNVKSASLK